MTRYLATRIGQAVLGTVAACLVVFLALQTFADPARDAYAIGTPEEVLHQYRERHGLLDPLIVQLGREIWDIVTLDFGYSEWQGGQALSIAFEHVPATLMLVAVGTVIGVGGGIVGGIAATRRPTSLLSRGLEVVANITQSMPEYYTAILLILVFAVRLHWLPAGGYDPLPRTVLLPALALAVNPFGQTLQLTRTTMLAERRRPYVMTAWAKGLDDGEVTRRHIFKNSAVPIGALFFYTLSRNFAGSALTVEVIFGWPGIGRLAISAIQRGDYNMIAAVVFLSALATGIAFVTADLLSFAIDPRTRHLVKTPRLAVS